MMENTELIKVLRCELYGDDECDKSDCPIWSELGCRNGIANRAAADALEAAEKRIAELGAQIPKEGKWIENDDGNSIYFKCSVCGKNQYNVLLEMMQGEYHYCPNCGAKMNGETEQCNTYSLGKIEMPKGAIEQIIADGERKDGEG